MQEAVNYSKVLYIRWYALFCCPNSSVRHQFEPQVEASDAAGGSGVNLKRRDSLV